MYSVLYVDDEDILLELGKLFLEKMGDFRVETITSATDALPRLSTATFDAIISDYQMPGMDGIEFLRKVRSSGDAIPFILFTGRGREEVVIEAINNGADFYIQKGGEPKAQFAELAHKIRQAVSRRRYEGALADSEHILADIIDFLPDATFAIDTNGTVIAWNRAMEEMTGTAATNILGKGNYEHAMAFYGERRLMLIDLVNKRDPEFEKGNYSLTRHAGSVITAETHVEKEGSRIYYWGKANLLFNRQGERTGAIESVRDITNWKLSELALIESEQKFQTLFMSNPSLEVVTDIQTSLIVDVNTEFLNTIGFTREEVIGKTAQDIGLLSYMEDRPFFENLVKNKEPFHNLKSRIRTCSGAIRTMKISAQVISVGGQDLIFTQAIDITEQEQADDDAQAAYEQLAAAEEELKAQFDELKLSQDTIQHKEHFLRSVFGSIQDGISILDENMTVIDVNRTMEQWYQNEMPLMGRKCYEVYHNRTKRCDVCPSITTLQTGNPAIETIPLVDGDVVKGWLELYSFPFIDATTGRMKGVIEYVHNITDRRQKEEELRAAYDQLTTAEEKLRRQYEELVLNEKRIRESEEKFKAVFESAGDAIFIMDQEVILDCNITAEKIFQCTREQIVGKSQLTLSPEFQADGTQSQEKGRRLIEAALQGMPQYFEWVHLHHDGTPFDAEVTLNRFVMHGRYYLQGIVRDISAKKKTEEELRSSYAQIAESEEELRVQCDALVENRKALVASEAKYRGILDSMQDVYYRTDGAGILTMLSRSGAELLGYDSPDEMIGIPASSFYADPAERDSLVEILRKEGKVTGMKVTLTRRDGTLVPVSTNSHIWNDEMNGFGGIEGTFREIG